MFPRNDQIEGPFSKRAKYSSYAELEIEYLNLPPYELDPIQKKKITSQIAKCETLKILLRRKAFGNDRSKVAIIQLQDSINILRKIKNTHQHLEKAKTIMEAITYWESIQMNKHSYIYPSLRRS